jgi:hypothetical protein
VTTKVDEYRANAHYCKQLAEQTVDSVIKEQLLKLRSSGGTWPPTKKRAGSARSRTRPLGAFSWF